MKHGLSLTLLAALLACEGKKSDKAQDPSTSPVVSLDSNVGNIPSSGDDIVVVSPEDSSTPETDTEVTPVTEAAKPIPEALLGFGYHKFQREVKEKCSTGDIVLDASNSSTTFGFVRYSNYEQFQSSFSNENQGSILNKWAGVDFRDRFFSSNSDESLSANYVFATTIVNGTKRYTNSEIAVKLDPNSFLNKCGSHYINSAIVGGAFVASISLDFTSSEAKSSFEAESFTFDKISDVLVREANESSEARRVASIKITYAQVGGGGTLVPGITATDLLSCSLDSVETLKSCTNTLEKLGSYAISSEFLKAIKDYPAIHSFTINKY